MVYIWCSEEPFCFCLLLDKLLKYLKEPFWFLVNSYNMWSKNFVKRSHHTSCRYWILNDSVCCIHYSKDCRCFSVGRTTPKNCLFLWGISIFIQYIVLLVHTSQPSNCILICAAIFAWLKNVTNRQTILCCIVRPCYTVGPCYSVCSNRPHLAIAAMQSKNYSIGNGAPRSRYLPYWIFKVWYFNFSYSSEGQYSSLCQILCCSVKLLSRYGLFDFSRWQPSATWICFTPAWDHPWRAADGLYRCAKIGWNRQCSFEHIWFLMLCDFCLKMLIHIPFRDIFGIKMGANGNFLQFCHCSNLILTSCESNCIKIGSAVQSGDASKI